MMNNAYSTILAAAMLDNAYSPILANLTSHLLPNAAPDSGRPATISVPTLALWKGAISRNQWEQRDAYTATHETPMQLHCKCSGTGISIFTISKNRLQTSRESSMQVRQSLQQLLWAFPSGPRLGRLRVTCILRHDVLLIVRHVVATLGVNCW